MDDFRKLPAAAIPSKKVLPPGAIVKPRIGHALLSNPSRMN
jgi:hypothetical protein